MRAGFVLLIAGLFGACLSGQTTANAITRLTMNHVPPEPDYIDVRFADGLDKKHDEDLSPSNIKLSAVPGGATVAVQSTSRTQGTLKGVRIIPSAPLTGEQVRVCFATLHSLDSAGKPVTATQVCAAGDILTAANIVAHRDAQLQTLQSTPKSSSEKNIFASGFLDAGSGKSQGGTDISLNSNDLGISGMTAYMQLKKATATGADPKTQSIGLNWRMASVFGSKQFDQIGQHISAYGTSQSQAELKTADDMMRDFQKRTWSAVTVDAGIKIEGEALNFNVANSLGDITLSILSRTKALGSSRRGFWKAKLTPAGFEGGKPMHTLQTVVVAATGPPPQWLGRYKVGGECTLFYANPDATGPVKRVELNAGVVDRQLLIREPVISTTNNIITKMVTGNKPWAQADLNVFFADTPSGRYGIRFNYERGSLPPVYASTKVFQIGLVMETPDDTKKAK